MKNSTFGYYRTNRGKPIYLDIFCTNSFLMIDIKNCVYEKEKIKRIKRLISVAIIYIIRIVLYGKSTIVDIIFATLFVIFLLRIIYLVKFESLKVISNFCVQGTTSYFGGYEKNLLIPTDNIYDIIINEVICNFSVNYMLTARTKTVNYRNKRLLPFFTNLWPSIECLEIIYRKYQQQIALGNV